MAKNTTQFVKVIKGSFEGNLGNLWEWGKGKVVMLKSTSKKTVKGNFVFAARPMVTKATKTEAPRLFGFESKFYTDTSIDEKLDSEPSLQFLQSAQSWIRGYELKEDSDGIQPKYHAKLGRAHRIRIVDPQLCSIIKTDDDGTKYTEYFLRVVRVSQVAPVRNLEREAPSPDSIYKELEKSGAKPIIA